MINKLPLPVRIAGVIALVAVALSLLFHVPYAVTIGAVIAWAAFGHFVTLDDDAPGGWSNPDGNKGFWRRSIGVAALKFLVLGIFIALLAAFPRLLELGAT